MKNKMAFFVLSVCVGVGLTACDQRPSSFVGRIENSVFIGLLSSHGVNLADGSVLVCEANSGLELFRDLKLDSDGRFFEKINPSGARLKVGIQNAGLTSLATGSYTSATGKEFSYRIFSPQGNAGIYRAEENVEGERWVGSWIVAEDGQVCGMQTSASGKTRNQPVLSKSAMLVTAPSQLAGFSR